MQETAADGRTSPGQTNMGSNVSDWDVEAWRSVLFSDEAKISIGTDGVLHVWCCKGKSICRNVVI